MVVLRGIWYILGNVNKGKKKIRQIEGRQIFTIFLRQITEVFLIVLIGIWHIFGIVNKGLKKIPSNCSETNFHDFFTLIGEAQQIGNVPYPQQ